jgi:sugar O-acyltransferase (sialic acid O-acetyltransferase NeuD family)
MIKRPMIIFGGGGLGREVKTIVDVLPDLYVDGFCDDGIPKGNAISGLPVLGNTDFLLRHSDVEVVVAIGNSSIKLKVVEKLSRSSRISFVTLIHPRAILGDLMRIQVGEGTIITAGCILTTDIIVGNHVLVNLNTTIGHDVKIDDCTSIMPGVNIAGDVKIGRHVLIGSGANILNGVTIGDGAIIGAGAVVRTDIKAGATAVGVPAKEIKY